MGKRHTDKLLWVGKNLKIFVSQVNAQQRVTSAEEHVNNQVASTTCFVETSLLRQLPLSLPSRLKNEVTLVAGVVMHGFGNMDCH